MRNPYDALLSLLDQPPLTEDIIGKTFGQAMTNLCRAGHSQVYPELKRLT